MIIDTEFMAAAFPLLAKAVPMTLFLTFFPLLLALTPAFLIALIRIRGKGLGNELASSYISLVRSTPLVLQILLLYSLLPSFLNMIVKSAGSSFNVFEEINTLWYAVIIFTLHAIAILAEVFRSAILAIPKGQMEAGLTAGLSRLHIYADVIIPQAMVSAFPNICNLTVNLVKGTSLAFFMGVKDILAEAKIEAAFGYNYIEAYLEVFLFYIVICTVVQVAYRLAERRIGAYRFAGQEGL